MTKQNATLEPANKEKTTVFFLLNQIKLKTKAEARQCDSKHRRLIKTLRQEIFVEVHNGCYEVLTHYY